MSTRIGRAIRRTLWPTIQYRCRMHRTEPLHADPTMKEQEQKGECAGNGKSTNRHEKFNGKKMRWTCGTASFFWGRPICGFTGKAPLTPQKEYRMEGTYTIAIAYKLRCYMRHKHRDWHYLAGWGWRASLWASPLHIEHEHRNVKNDRWFSTEKGVQSRAVSVFHHWINV